MDNAVLGGATDAQLLGRFHEEQDEQAFAAIIQRHGAMVQAVAARVLDCDSDIDDATQATFFALARSAPRLRSRSTVAAWLYRTAFTCAIEVRRANIRWKKRTVAMKDKDTDYRTTDERTGSADDPSTRVGWKELQDVLHEELRRLPNRLQTAVILCELEGLTHAQAAEQLGVPTSTVSNRVAKGRQLLRDRIGRRGVAITLAGITVCFASFAKASTGFSSTFAADVARSAKMYASGLPATAITVSAEVIHIANKVVFTIAKTKMVTATLTVLAMGAIAWATSKLTVGPDATEVTSHGAFVDTFSDSRFNNHEPVSYKGVPVTWKHWPSEPVEVTFESQKVMIASQVEAQGGKLVVSGRGVASAATADYGYPVLNLADMSVRSHVRLLKGRGVFINPIRNHFGPPPGYYGIVGDGYAEIRYGGVWKEIARCDTDLVVKGQDVVIQFDAIDDVLSLWAWPAGQEMPKEPLLRVVDTAVPTTNRGDLMVGAIGTTAKAEFYYVHVGEKSIGAGETKKLICDAMSYGQ